MLQLYSPGTMQGVAARFVATETLTFLLQVLKSQHGRLINILGDARRAEVSVFIAQMDRVVGEFKTYMYRNVHHRGPRAHEPGTSIWGSGLVDKE